MAQRLITLDHEEDISVGGGGGYVTKTIETGDANYEIVDILIDAYSKGLPTVSVSQSTVKNYYKWDVGFVNAGNQDCTFRVKMLVMTHPQPYQKC